ncbi:hypothetical protein VZ95_03420 [Elstera litoralis]|uniref:Uncharacterized protein n=1 Tax=Elstera litoralis TaxID=552518 RepID=A0A0F3IVU4_9PROT|nr:hypothetical protein [Elstera litoralis]KJV10658.1 hypothetical protein VZ95_03420 [Elstera litoralis]
MVNLTLSNRRRRFYLWLDPRLPTVRKQVSLFGRIETADGQDDPSSVVLTVAGAPAPTPSGVEQPAQRRIHRAEIVLENYRATHLAAYPARARAALVFDRLEDAWLYHDMHRDALSGHVLKLAETRGLFAVSLHDSLWTEILAGYDSEAVDTYVTRAYWAGETTVGRIPDGVIFNRLRRPERIPALEGLFYGTLRFPDQQLERHDLPRPAAVRARLAAWGGGDWNLVHEPGEESEAVALDASDASEDEEDDLFAHEAEEDPDDAAHRQVSEIPKAP